MTRMRHFLYLIVFMLTVIGCTGRQTADGVAKMSEVVYKARQNLDMGVEYDKEQNQMGIAELYYRKSYETLKDNPSQAWDIYAEAGYRYACMLYQHGDLEGAQAVADDMLKKAEDNKDFSVTFKAGLLSLMAQCQLRLAMPEASKQTFAKAYELQLSVLGGEQKGDFNLAITCADIFLSFFKMGEYDEAGKWLKRYEEELRACEQLGEGDSLIISEHNGLLALFKARYIQDIGRAKEAAAIYDAIPRSQLVNPSCIENAAYYLMDASRYAEAADMYARLDSTFAAVDSFHTTFDKISQRLIPRYVAYHRAGRIPEAMKVADKTFAAIDSAIMWQKQKDAAELAVIYQTHEKDLAIEESEARAVIYLIILASAVIIILLIVHLLLRARKYNNVLLEKNRELYEQIQQREQAEAKQHKQMEAQPAEALTQNQQLYRRLCELMKDSAVYTDAETNHDTLARLLGTNRTYINDVLHECADTTPADFINQYRIRHAARLLSTTDDPIGLIIEQSGITNRATFSRLFREQYSMTPSEFRQAAR